MTGEKVTETVYVPDLVYRRKMKELRITFIRNNAPKIVWDDEYIEISTNDVKIYIKLMKDDDMAANNRNL